MPLLAHILVKQVDRQVAGDYLVWVDSFIPWQVHPIERHPPHAECQCGNNSKNGTSSVYRLRVIGTGHKTKTQLVPQAELVANRDVLGFVLECIFEVPPSMKRLWPAQDTAVARRP